MPEKENLWLQKIATQLQETNALLKVLVGLNLKDITLIEKVDMLTTMGFSPSEIAEITGTTSGSVRVAKTISKKRKLKNAQENPPPSV